MTNIVSGFLITRPHAQDVQEAMIVALGRLAAVVATALFIFALNWHERPQKARRGVYAGVAGMAIAVVATWIQPEIVHHGWILLAVVAGFVVRRALSSTAHRGAAADGAVACIRRPRRGLVGTAEFHLWLSEGAERFTTFRTSALVIEVILASSPSPAASWRRGNCRKSVDPQRPVTYPGQNFVNLGVLGGALVLGVMLVLPRRQRWAPNAFLAIIGVGAVVRRTVDHSDRRRRPCRR